MKYVRQDLRKEKHILDYRNNQKEGPKQNLLFGRTRPFITDYYDK